MLSDAHSRQSAEAPPCEASPWDVPLEVGRGSPAR